MSPYNDCIHSWCAPTLITPFIVCFYNDSPLSILNVPLIMITPFPFWVCPPIMKDSSLFVGCPYVIKIAPPSGVPLR